MKIDYIVFGLIVFAGHSVAAAAADVAVLLTSMEICSPQSYLFLSQYPFHQPTTDACVMYLKYSMAHHYHSNGSEIFEYLMLLQ